MSSSALTIKKTITPITGGTTFTVQSGISADGKYMYSEIGVATGGGFWYSHDYGQTFTQSADIPVMETRGFSCDGTGQFCFITEQTNKRLYYSSNYGVNWSIIYTFANNPYYVSSSQDGKYVLICVNGYGIYLYVNQTKRYYNNLEYTGALTLSTTSNQLALGTGSNILTISSVQTGNNYTLTIPNIAGASEFVMTQSNQTIAGTKTFSSALAMSATSNQFAFPNLTLTTTPTANRTHTIPSGSVNDTFLMVGGNQSLLTTSIGSANASVSMKFLVAPNYAPTPSANTMMMYMSNDATNGYLTFTWKVGSTQYSYNLNGGTGS
ncbi:Uncharacterised protein [uncultured archaeon]|nr:Uncharacterised protein [uncultured archaeon]